MTFPSNSPLTRLRLRYASWQNKRRIDSLARQVAQHARPNPGKRPVVVFNASTRLTGLSLNAAFSQITAWGLRLAGVPVVHFVCGSGMSRCVLGTNREDYGTPPPCGPCIAQSRRFYAGADVRWWAYKPDPDLSAALQNLSVAELSEFELEFSIPPERRCADEIRQPSPSPSESAESPLPAYSPSPLPHPSSPEFPRAPSSSPLLPLGRIVLPSIRWALRRHHLPDDEPTRFLLREYILSAYRVASEFARLLEEVNPAAVVIFNGMMYPEAAARWVARQYGLRVITHEVGFQRYSAFFTEGEATAYPMHIPSEFELTPEQNALLDENLEQRFQGKFTMAGIRFWPEMRGLDQAFLERAARFHQIVPVFTNVVYDTSQVHANVVFPHMFAWLDTVLEVIRAHPETLFVIRAHPDEMRPGTAKQSRESVCDWVQRNGVDRLPNVVFIDSQEYISSYELIQRSKFVVVYNSSIGLEATLLGTAVLCGGKARYTQYPIVFFPQTADEYRRQLEVFLDAEAVPVPPEFQRNARRFLYYQLFRASIPLKEYLQTGPRPGFVQFRSFSWQQLCTENSPSLETILEGILDGKPFLND